MHRYKNYLFYSECEPCKNGPNSDTKEITDLIAKYSLLCESKILSDIIIKQDPLPLDQWIRCELQLKDVTFHPQKMYRDTLLQVYLVLDCDNSLHTLCQKLLEALFTHSDTTCSPSINRQSFISLLQEFTFHIHLNFENKPTANTNMCWVFDILERKVVNQKITRKQFQEYFSIIDCLYPSMLFTGGLPIQKDSCLVPLKRLSKFLRKVIGLYPWPLSMISSIIRGLMDYVYMCSKIDSTQITSQIIKVCE